MKIYFRLCFSEDLKQYVMWYCRYCKKDVSLPESSKLKSGVATSLKVILPKDSLAGK